MEYLTYCRVGRMMLFSMSIAIIVCMLFHLGRAADERESESSFDNDNVNENSKSSVSDGDDVVAEAQDPEQSKPATETDKIHKASTLEAYKQLFAQNRATQLTGVKALLRFGNDEQRFSLVQVLLKQLFKTLGDAKENLTIAGYSTGDPFPTNETTRHAFSKVLENTALFGDIVLRLPDAVHSVYGKDKEWQLLLSWCYGFCKESGVFEGASQKLLHLMAQEVKIIPKEPSFINPFKEAHRLEMESLKQRKVEKKPKKKIARGPRLRHTEL